jgi:uncharacterized protein YfbU (UPF0304 family)
LLKSKFDILKFEGPRSAIEVIIGKTAFENSYKNLNSIQQLNKKIMTFLKHYYGLEQPILFLSIDLSH